MLLHLRHLLLLLPLLMMGVARGGGTGEARADRDGLLQRNCGAGLPPSETFIASHTTHTPLCLCKEDLEIGKGSERLQLASVCALAPLGRGCCYQQRVPSPLDALYPLHSSCSAC